MSFESGVLSIDVTANTDTIEFSTKRSTGMMSRIIESARLRGKARKTWC